MPIVRFNNWRVAVANYKESLKEENFDSMERHLLTDEVFILTKGSAVLFVGKGKRRISMEYGKIYNIRKGIWHHICMEPDSSVIIVENDNTFPENSENMDFNKKGTDYERAIWKDGYNNRSQLRDR